ncbi:cox-type terminal oxidase subunit II [Natronomonas pharaonis DSM 2160]|uniref:Cox-type terminal oxidase subunit II n=1 Tax=Natronomonas pharaonis (strain ATCC 35678 / DSM 2160 / CIP 103997 / JCM 8858 / NBRC 14720 / NCIMB 2260 / Gabara) TaxID=348780 RepID=A0A1U7EYE6_NATPD|nr:cytochrome c oxidase subunit II [Natronomonas pharaonis]CAI50238.1 cox-type terminal oxidase subunit II [Natronomonas pharaonis DSM 2160]
MSDPLDEPEGNWWDEKVNRRETMWLGIAGLWSLGIFGWMSGFTRFGDQNPVGETYEVTPEEFQAAVDEYKEAADETEDGHLIPPGDSVYIAGRRFDWDGLPVVLEAGREYDIHLGAYDVQHGFSVRPEETLSKQINLQIFPDHEWVIPMTFEEPGTYQVICNEFCGRGHNGMQGKFIVEEP